MVIALMEKWSTINFPDHGICLEGIVYDHPRLPDGHRAITSPLVAMEFGDQTPGCMIARSQNTLYALGVPNLPDSSIL